MSVSAPSLPPAATPESPRSTQGTGSKCKRKRTNAAQVQAQFTIRNPAWTYLHLRLLTSSSSKLTQPDDVDAITFRTHLMSALTQFLGAHGAAIPIDVLKIRAGEVWVRVPRDDGAAVVAGVSGWVGGGGNGAEGGSLGWRVLGRSDWLASLETEGEGQALFSD
ncbi:hypothetical protein B0A49_06491 [Cryomyces minteri]|uniref:Ribonucleases P/MRP subunit Pop8-like domain-containing protein n=1 Tax=Cryomyces minteri TaxID=331657 RepID=A0A4U0WZ70_9PEZI|nr:hypothetical protein B0A49_06491 [Cryomyces minteri]